MLNPTREATERTRVVVVTWLFGYPWDPTRGIYNQQQFDRLAKQVELSVMVAVPWTVVLRNFAAFMSARRSPSLRDYPIRYFVSFHLPGIGRSLSGVLYLLSLITQLGVPIVRARAHCLIGSWSYPDGFATSVLGKILRIPVVLKIHGSDVNLYTLNALRRWQIRVACNGAYKTVCVSQALGDRLIAIGVDRKRVAVNYNGVDQQRFTDSEQAPARLELNIAAHVPVILFVGNVLDSKGAADLLEAFVKLRERRPTAQLIYIGDGADRLSLEQRVRRLNLADAVRFTGKQDHALLVRWYVAADLLCLPSHAEGVPNVILEAMACGRPVVASCVGGIPEVLPPFAGRMVAPRDTNALAIALDEALADSWNSAKIVAHARNFTWTRNVATMHDIVMRAAKR